MASGVTVAETARDLYEALKKDKKHRYVFFEMSEDKGSIVGKNGASGPRDATYDDFLANFEETKPCYALYDFHYEKPGEGQRDKVIFYSWIPDTASIRDKMIYSSSKVALKKSFDVAFEIQGTDPSEISYETVLEKALRSN
ncbi:13960_t:CDS:2 [Entrophospora sp. SA101]|nr:6731_t:CDS:2 [Entrophospora sp. SA101]CAJ0896588.1 13960_t:CDS:2 [Entrophospora sp. SA101]